MRPVTVALSSRPALKPSSVPIAMTALPFKGGRSEAGGRSGAQRPERAPRQGREGKEPHQRRVRAPCASCERVTERLRFPINSDEHSAKRYARSGPLQPLAPEHRDKPGASSSQQSTEEKQRGDVKRAGASARTSEHDRASACQTTTADRRPRRTLRTTPPCSHRSATGSPVIYFRPDSGPGITAKRLPSFCIPYP
ncbi:MAG: hypothetical protein A4E34_00646 [Methanoregula sp. PtaU1.Bin006]|jgi:hypothetical protein|nr:MAG: hypothetical protein A4E34_00646 [Methanoregula sp. PtaU1.Bin006]